MPRGAYHSRACLVCPLPGDWYTVLSAGSVINRVHETLAPPHIPYQTSCVIVHGAFDDQDLQELWRSMTKGFPY